MIPIIFGSDAITFTSNGLGRLTDCISCLVTEARNGIFECEFTYPITGVHYDRIHEGNIIVVSHDEQKDRQPFIIYRISRPINGVITVNAHHITYRLSNIVVSPFTASSVADAFNSISVNSMIDNPFTFWTDKVSAGSMTVDVPTVCKSILGGKEGSILDSFGGGEYKWDNFVVRLYDHRGSNNGVSIRYGKNLTNITAERDTLGLYNAVVPFWSDRESTVVYGGVVVGNGGVRRTVEWTDENGATITDENSNIIDFGYYVRQVVTLDLSSEFEDKPTVSQLESRALTFLNSNQPWIPKDNIKVDFVALWQTEEYKDIAPLERVQLCDTVNIYYPELGVDATAKVVKVVWNALLERYDSIELGEAKTSFADTVTNTIVAETNEKLETVPTMSMMDKAINHATDLITGGLGGHIVFLYDANGKPTDMLVMDTEDVNTAVHVLRINVNGIGFSSTGVSGTYTSAWTLDGSFVADFITAGHLSCNRIQGGTLTLGGANNGNGTVIMYDADGNETGRWNNTSFYTESKVAHFELNAADKKTSNVYTHGSFKMYPLGNSNLGIYFSIARPGYSPGTMIEVTNLESANNNMIKLNTVESASSTTPKTVFAICQNDTYFGMGDYNGGSTASGYGSVRHGSIAWGKGCFKVNLENVYDTSGIPEIIDASTLRGLYISCYDSTYITNPKNTYARFRYEGGQGCKLDVNGKDGKVSIYASSSLYLYGDSSGWKTNNGTIGYQSSSSKRYKHDITEEIDEALNAHKLYGLQMKQFVFNSDHVPQYADMAGKTIPGFIAEDVAEVYPSAAIHDADGNIESWDERRIIPGMLALIQEQKQQLDEQQKQIERLTERLAKLENMVEKLMR